MTALLRSRCLRVAGPAIALAVAPVIASAGTYTSPGGAILDNSSQSITFAVTDVGAVTHVDLTLTSLTHSWAGDIIATLSGPGDVVSGDIMRRLGASTSSGLGDSSDFNGTYRFIDSGVDPVPPLVALPATGVLPSGDYWATTLGTNTTSGNKVTLDTVFAAVGSATGTWTLRISDNAGGDTGGLQSATLNITTTDVPEPVSIGALGLIGAGMLMRRRRGG